jgi:phosphoglycolate phosphatase
MIEAVILDLDGTLVDSADGVVAAYQRTLQNFGRGPLPEESLRRTIGIPTRQCLRALLGEGCDLAGALAYFRHWFEIEGVNQARCYDGMITAAERLRALQLRLLVCTARPRQTAVQTLRHLGLMPYFDAIHGAEEDGRLEAKQELLSVLMAQHHYDGSSAVMVGDRSSDIMAARAHDMRAIAVTWGYGQRRELIDAHPFALCERPSRLVGIVRRVVPLRVHSRQDRTVLSRGDF